MEVGSRKKSIASSSSKNCSVNYELPNLKSTSLEVCAKCRVCHESGHQEEHYATFRSELEAIINAGDVEDGPLDVISWRDPCAHGMDLIWEIDLDCMNL